MSCNDIAEGGSEDGEEEFDNNFPFFINKSGLPIEKKTWDRMWKFACRLYPDAKKEIERINNAEDLERVSWKVISLHKSFIQSFLSLFLPKQYRFDSRWSSILDPFMPNVVEIMH